MMQGLTHGHKGQPQQWSHDTVQLYLNQEDRDSQKSQLIHNKEAFLDLVYSADLMKHSDELKSASVLIG